MTVLARIILWVFNFVTNFSFVLFLAAMMFCIPLKKRKFFWLRFIPSATLYNGLRFIIPHFYSGRYMSIGWFSFSYPIAVALVFGIIYLCFEVKVVDNLFYVTVAYAVQNLAYHTVQLLMRLVWGYGFNMSESDGRYIMRFFWNDSFDIPVNAAVWSYAAVAVTVHAAVLGLYYLLIRRMRTSFGEKEHVRVLVASSLIMAVVYVLDMWARAYSFTNAAVDIYAALTCMLLILLQAGIFRQSRFDKEQEMMHELLKLEHKQQQISKENVSLLNVKFHDLKHQLSVLRTASGQENNIKEIEKTIGIYDSFVKTGNEVLDLILTEKSLICEKKGIRMGIIADGSAVDFIDSADIGSMFGNILNNAIEAVDNIDESKRLISLNVSKRKGFLTVHEDNWCEKQLTFKDGLPMTTQEDNGFHGFGTKSIKMIASKYGGSVSMSCEDNRFCLDVMIPLPA